MAKHKSKYKPHLWKSAGRWLVAYRNSIGVLYPPEMIPFMSRSTIEAKQARTWAANTNRRLLLEQRP